MTHLTLDVAIGSTHINEHVALAFERWPYDPRELKTKLVDRFQADRLFLKDYVAEDLVLESQLGVVIPDLPVKKCECESRCLSVR